MPVESISPASSMIQSATYDDDTHTLSVTMHNGKTYETPNFTDDQWRAFQGAESAGSWYRQNVMRLVR